VAGVRWNRSFGPSPSRRLHTGHRPSARRFAQAESLQQRQLLAQTTFDLAGEVEAVQAFGNRVVLASAGEIAEIDAESLHKLRVRPFAAPATKPLLYRLCPTGLWLIGEPSIAYFDLDGHAPMVKARPLLASDKPPCPAASAEVKRPCSAGLQIERTKAVASEASDLLIVEVSKELYPYSDPPGQVDEVWPSAAFVLDSKGTVVGQEKLSWMDTKREWFWSKSGGAQNPTGIPRWGGLVRTRYETAGHAPGQPVSERGRNFLLSSGGGKGDMVLRLVDRQLHMLWKKSLRNLSSPIVSPAWASPILLHDNVCHDFATINDRGSDKQERTLEIPDLYQELWNNHFKSPRLAIGQDNQGDWLLIAY